METKNLKRSILVLSVVMAVYNLIVLNIAYYLDYYLPNIVYSLIGIFYALAVFLILSEKPFLITLRKWSHYFFMAFIITDFALFLLKPDVQLPVLDWAARAISITLLAFLWIHLQKCLDEDGVEELNEN